MKKTHIILLAVAHTGFVLGFALGLFAWHDVLMLNSALSKSAHVYTESMQTWYATLGIVTVLLALLAAGMQYALRNNKEMRYINIPGYIAWFTAILTIGVIVR
jgi:hypothetical protein